MSTNYGCTNCGLDDHATTECPYGRTPDRYEDLLLRLEGRKRGPVHAVDPYTPSRQRVKALEAELQRLNERKRTLETWLTWTLVALLIVLSLGVAIAFRIQGVAGGVQ